jgi:hypothetical protein
VQLFFCPFYSLPLKRIIGQVLISSINSLQEHILLRNAKRLDINSGNDSLLAERILFPQMFLFMHHDTVTVD